MTIIAKYVHTNLVAKDWKNLANFYQKVFGCLIVPPERDFKGGGIEKGTGIKGAHLQGVHLRLPGYESDGPTLEIFSYNPSRNRLKTSVNSQGYGHIAFQVDDVVKAREEVFANGGKEIGEIVTLQIQTGARITWCYVSDPEGNIIELQSSQLIFK
jgi:predicted enzyme related to lactoylglutathione lyase